MSRFKRHAKNGDRMRHTRRKHFQKRGRKKK